MRGTEFIKSGYLALLVASLSFGGMAIDPAVAQQGPDDYGGEDNGRDNPTNNTNGRSANNPYGIIQSLQIQPSATTPIVTALRDAGNFCSRMRDQAYLVDCIGERLENITQHMSKSGDYVEAREILSDTSRKLRRLAASNRSPSKPKGRLSGPVNRKPVTTRALVAVRSENVKKVNQQAVNILAEAETKLLRSAEASDRRLIAYAQMAKAVGSNKTLLRSA